MREASEGPQQICEEEEMEEVVVCMQQSSGAPSESRMPRHTSFANAFSPAIRISLDTDLDWLCPPAPEPSAALIPSRLAAKSLAASFWLMLACAAAISAGVCTAISMGCASMLS